MSIRVFQRPKERIQVLLRRQPLSKMGQRCASGPFQRVRGGSEGGIRGSRRRGAGPRLRPSCRRL